MFMSKFIWLKPLQQTLPACLAEQDSGLLPANTAGKLHTASTAKAAAPMLALHNVIKHIVYKTDFIHMSYPQTLPSH